MRASLLPALLATALFAGAAVPALATGGKHSDHGGGHPCKSGKKCSSDDFEPDFDFDRPLPFSISRPGNDRGAYIIQIGEENDATIEQSANTQYALIGQAGPDNTAEVTQAGSGAHYAIAAQIGWDNKLELDQAGASAQVAILKQAGGWNEMDIDQRGGSVSSGVAALQLGSGNEMSLTQSGSGNHALLVQLGSNNEMTATQTGGNNQLSWTQVGYGVSDLRISQSGGQALQVVQAR